MFTLILCFIYQNFLPNEKIIEFMTHTTHPAQGIFLSSLTSLFFHNSVAHLLTNIVALFIFGRIVEKNLGIGVGAIFLVGGFLANIISNLVANFLGESFYSLGASTGVAALVIFAILLEPIKLHTIIGWIIITIDLKGIFQETTTNHLGHLAGYSTLLVLFFFIGKATKKRIMKGVIVNVILLCVTYGILKISNLF